MSTPTPTPPAPAPSPTPTPAPTPAPAPPADGAAAPQTPPAPAQEPTDWKAEARKWEERAKENKKAADRLAEYEESQKTEAQKAADRAAAAEAKVAAYEKREQIAKWKDEVSKETGVPAAALAGSSLEEIQAHAETLKPLIAAPATDPTPLAPHVPGEGTPPSGGAATQLTENDLKSMTPEQINQARRSGRLNRLMGIS